MNHVQVYKDKMRLPTYELLEDNLNPVFDRGDNPYPYTLQDFKSYDIVDKDYEVVALENEYIKIIVVPSMGGKLYRALDKRSGKEFFYSNPVVKPRMVATRGAWTSGGVEFNFPISHSPVTMDRVNYIIKHYEDGSASVIIGNIENISYMDWQVELKLFPGRTYIEEKVRLHNPTPYENRFYFWTNAAVEQADNMKMIYSFDWCTNIDKPGYVKWPYFKGMDCTDPNEIPFSFETFGKLMVDNFFGVYYFDADYGVVHYANRKQVKGAKFFEWGTDGLGVAWNKALNGDGKKYLEIQSGPFESQRVFRFMKPYQTLEWSEYWYPLAGTSGFKHATKELAVNFHSTTQGIEFVFAANEELKDSRIRLKIRGKELTTVKSLSPAKVERVAFGLGAPYSTLERFELDVYTGDRHILSMGKRDEFSDEYPGPELYENSSVMDVEKDSEKLYMLGLISESEGKMNEAFAFYKQNLEKNPACTLTLNRLGRIYLKKRLFDEAQACFRKVLAYDNRNSEARFLYAVAEKERGNITRARRLMMDIPCGEGYYFPSVIELAKLDMLLGYYDEAAMLLESCKDSRDSYIDFLLSICVRKEGFLEKAKEILKESKNVNEYILAERYLQNPAESERSSFKSYTGGDSRVIIPLVIQYLELNLLPEAKNLLGLVNQPSIKTHLLEMYIDRGMDNKKGITLKDVLEDSLDYAFVNEHFIARLLEENRGNDNSGKLEYLLGNYYYWLGRKDEALECFLSAYDKGLRYTVLLRNLGYIYYNYKKDMDLAARYFHEDLEVNNGRNEDSCIYLNRIYKERNELESRRKLLPYMEKAHNKTLVLAPMAEILKDIGEEDKALEVMSSCETENWEGFETSGALYREIMISKAEKELKAGNIAQAVNFIDHARNYPPELNYGEPAKFITLSDYYYYKGIIYSAAGREKEAMEAFKKGAAELDNPRLAYVDKARKYALKCIEEIQRRK